MGPLPILFRPKRPTLPPGLMGGGIFSAHAGDHLPASVTGDFAGTGWARPRSAPGGGNYSVPVRITPSAPGDESEAPPSCPATILAKIALSAVRSSFESRENIQLRRPGLLRLSFPHLAQPAIQHRLCRHDPGKRVSSPSSVTMQSASEWHRARLQRRSSGPRDSGRPRRTGCQNSLSRRAMRPCPCDGMMRDGCSAGEAERY